MKKLRVKDLSVGMVLREISLAKNNLISVQEFREIYTSDRTMLTVEDIYQAYDEEKSWQLLLDFEDLLLEAYHLLRYICLLVNMHSSSKDSIERYLYNRLIPYLDGILINWLIGFSLININIFTYWRRLKISFG
jgi:hypothetical protein